MAPRGAKSTPRFSWHRAVVVVALIVCGAVPRAGGSGVARSLAGSLDHLADALAERARPALERRSNSAVASSLDVGVIVTAPWPRLASNLAELVAGRLRALGAHSVLVARGGADDAWARANGLERLVRVELDLAGDKLRATGSVLALASGLWSEEVEARAHLYVETPLDPELSAYLPGPLPPAGAWQARGVAVGDLELLALAIGDTDGDGRAELVGATASELVAWSWQADPAGARLVERWRARLEGRPAAIQPRAALATLTVEAGAVIAHASPFDVGVRRRASGASEPTRGHRFVGLAGPCELEPGVDWFTAASCGAPAGELPERFWTAAALARDRAPTQRVVAAIVPGAAGGTLWLRVGAAAPVLQRGVGAQVALASLARGDVVVTSEPSEPGDLDALVIRALASGAPILHRVERLPGSVRAIAAGDLDGDGQAELVAVVRDQTLRKTELWIVR